MRKTNRVLAVILTTMMIVGCGTNATIQNAREQTHKAITLSAETYDVLMTSLGALYKKQIIGNAERDMAVDYANQFRAAALKIAEGVDNTEFEAQIQKMKDMIQKLKDLLSRAGIADAGIVEPLERMTRNMEAEQVTYIRYSFEMVTVGGSR